jgi:hypothetical protein
MSAFSKKAYTSDKGFPPIPLIKSATPKTGSAEDTDRNREQDTMSQIISNWTDEKTAQFQKEIFTFEHRLSETGLFTDEALVELLEKHPTNMLDVCTMEQAENTLYPNKFRTGDFRDTPGTVMLEAAKAGKVWINVRRAMNIHPEYKAVLDSMYGNLAEVSGSALFNANGGILISSPIAKVPYHFDKTEVILWHVRGQKRVYVYPKTGEFISDESHENALSSYIDDDLPFKDSFNDHATIIDLEDDQGACWPLHSPHRVDNRTFCVSVTTEYSTRESGMKNAAMITNSLLRHRFGMTPSYSQDGAVTRQVKSVFGRVIKKAGLLPNRTESDLVTFKLDPNVPDYIVDIEPFERCF